MRQLRNRFGESDGGYIYTSKKWSFCRSGEMTSELFLMFAPRSAGLSNPSPDPASQRRWWLMIGCSCLRSAVDLPPTFFFGPDFADATKRTFKERIVGLPKGFVGSFIDFGVPLYICSAKREVWPHFGGGKSCLGTSSCVCSLDLQQPFVGVPPQQ